MRILIGADIVPTKRNIDFFKTGDTNALLGAELQEKLNRADYMIFNLEVPLTEKQTPIDKCGIAISAPVKCVEGLKAMHADLLTLGNNHIMDQNEQGLISTISTLKKSNIAFVGAGLTKKEASKPFFFQCDGKQIGVFSCAEHEFSIASDNGPGANPIDLLESFDCVQEIKKNCDYLIVLYHGGKEQYRYPSPMLQRICRKFIDKGSDLVICQHSHCIGCEEKYKNGAIVYGQGNFVFDDLDNEYWKTSLLIQISDGYKIEYIPLIKHNNGVRLADSVTGEKILSDFYSRSQEIQNSDVLKQKYNDYASNNITELLSIALGKKYGFLMRAINKIAGNNRIIKSYINAKYSKNKRLVLLNRIECEAYNELFITGLKQSIKVENDN